LALCGFCGANKTLSNEHIFGDWVGRLLGTKQSDVIVRHAMASQSDLRGDVSPVHVWYADGLDHKVKMACKTCNSGWMSASEGAVKPVIAPMILGHARSVSFDDQIAISSWSIKTAMVQDFQHGGRHYFSSDERRLLVKDRAPEQLGARVWVGRYSPGGGVHSLSARLLTADRVLGAFVSTFTIGEFAVHALIERRSAGHLVIRPPARPGPWDRMLLSIWPPRRVADIDIRGLLWPPTLGMNAADLDKLFDRFMAPGSERPFVRRFGSS
jgi:hypothetical protein